MRRSSVLGEIFHAANKGRLLLFGFMALLASSLFVMIPGKFGGVDKGEDAGDPAQGWTETAKGFSGAEESGAPAKVVKPEPPVPGEQRAAVERGIITYPLTEPVLEQEVSGSVPKEQSWGEFLKEKRESAFAELKDVRDKERHGFVNVHMRPITERYLLHTLVYLEKASKIDNPGSEQIKAIKRDLVAARALANTYPYYPDKYEKVNRECPFYDTDPTDAANTDPSLPEISRTHPARFSISDKDVTERGGERFECKRKDGDIPQDYTRGR